MIWIGIDTGGTYTDAIALDASRRVIATAKALTTHWDLSLGLGAALRTVLAALPVGVGRADISLVSVSTTLATNAVVEKRFSPICTVLMGFDEPMVERSGLKREGNGFIVRVHGGHDPIGQELERLDEPAIEAAVREFGPRVDAFAVAGQFSVRNPEHELRARSLIRSLCHKPVTCSHELSSQLDAPKRALTAALNARLTPQIRHLLEALTQTLAQQSIVAPLMIVKGDGTLMRAEMALEYPVETVLSGPAASVVGAAFLSGEKSFAISDMGGTTTDVAIVLDERPLIRPEGAVIGGWRTMVQAIDVRTSGLGGDSEVHLDRAHKLAVGPRKVMPLSLLAHQFPGALEGLRVLAGAERLPPFAGRFAHRNPGRDARDVPPNLDRIERRVWDCLTEAPKRMDEVTRSTLGLDALRRLADRGFATLAGFTPSDAMHVLERQHGWSLDAAKFGAVILATEERNARGLSEKETAAALCERVYEEVVRAATRAVLEGAIAHDPGLESKHGSWGPLQALIDQQTLGRPFSHLLDAQIRLALPLVAIGAPVQAYYPEVARRLGARLCIPEHAAVCNAVGAVAGVVSETCDVLVNQTSFKVFRVHDPSGQCDYTEANPAIEHAKRVSRELALAAAQRAGADDPHVETTVIERRANAGSPDDYLAEATVRSRATGRPISRATAPKA